VNFLKNPNIMKAISLIVAVLGLVLILNSPEWGSKAALSWLSSIGGTTNTEEFLHMKTGYTNAYLTVGGIFLFAGLFSLLNKK